MTDTDKVSELISLLAQHTQDELNTDRAVKRAYEAAAKAAERRINTQKELNAALSAAVELERLEQLRSQDD